MVEWRPWTNSRVQVETGLLKLYCVFCSPCHRPPSNCLGSSRRSIYRVLICMSPLLLVPPREIASFYLFSSLLISSEPCLEVPRGEPLHLQACILSKRFQALLSLHKFPSAKFTYSQLITRASRKSGSEDIRRLQRLQEELIQYHTTVRTRKTGPCARTLELHFLV